MESTIKIVQKLLKDRKISAFKMCQATQISPSSVTDWKSGKARPGVGAIVAMAKFFHVSTDYLLGLDVREVNDGNHQQTA